jgi:hypothetical protein
VVTQDDWTENRALWNKDGQAIRDHLKELEG